MQLLCLKLFPLFSFSVFLPFLACSVGAVINLPENASVPAVIIFGDSIVDTGNNNYINTIAKANYPPYGQDFMGGKPTGRFSNGKVPSDLLAEGLGIKPVLPAYLDPSLQAQDLLTGVNFASGAAGYDPLTSELSQTVLSLSDQLELFKDYIAKLKNIAGDERSSRIVSESLIAVVVGSNDITNTYFLLPVRQLQYDIASYTKLLVCYASSFVQLGARRIGVAGLPPIGCVPSQRTLRGGLERNCVDKYNQAAQLFNEKLSDELTSLNTRYPEASIVYIDIYSLLLDIIRNPQKYGFEISNKGCCGTGTIEVTYLCTYPCADVSEYVFWDSFHPTEKAYRLIVNQILEQYANIFRCGKSVC